MAWENPRGFDLIVGFFSVGKTFARVIAVIDLAVGNLFSVRFLLASCNQDGNVGWEAVGCARLALVKG